MRHPAFGLVVIAALGCGACSHRDYLNKVYTDGWLTRIDHTPINDFFPPPPPPPSPPPPPPPGPDARQG